MNLIELGNGNYVLNHGTHGGKPALFIERAKSPQPVGGDARGENLPMDAVQSGGTVITFETFRGAAMRYRARAFSTEERPRPPHTPECVSVTGLQCDCFIVDYARIHDRQLARRVIKPIS